MGLHVDSSDVNLVNIGMAQTYTALTSTARWTITSETDGYVFRCNNSDDRVLTPMYSSTNAGTLVNAVLYVSGNRAQKWILESAPSFTDQLILYDEETGEFVTYSSRPVRCVKPGDSVEFSELGLETAFSSMNTINQTVTWSSSDSSIVSVNQNTGKITGVSKGEATITVTAATSDGGTRVNHYTVRCYPYWVKVNVLYDHGYLSRYPEAILRINSHMEDLHELFDTNYEIYVDYKSPVIFESLADSCPIAGNDYEEACCCGTCQDSNPATGTISETHHKNQTNVLMDIDRPDETTACVAFIGHVLCSASSHDTQPANGLAYFPYRVCTIYSFDNHPGFGLSDEACEYRTLVHEFGHLFGVIDHYGEGYATTEQMESEYGYDFDDDCIYGRCRNFEDNTVNITVCPSCQTMIRNNLAHYMP